jgi:hypothetical protein
MSLPDRVAAQPVAQFDGRGPNSAVQAEDSEQDRLRRVEQQEGVVTPVLPRLLDPDQALTLRRGSCRRGHSPRHPWAEVPEVLGHGPRDQIRIAEPFTSQHQLT